MTEIDASLRRLGHRLRRPLPDPPLGLRDADRGDARGAARRREGRQGPLPRRLVDVRLAVLQGALPGRPPRLDAVRLDAEPLQPALPRGGAGDAAASARPRASACSPGARWPAGGWPGRGTRRASTERAGSDEFGKTLYAGTEEADRAVVDRVGEVAAARGVPRAQVALAWLLAQARRHRADRRRDEAAPPGGRGGRPVDQAHARGDGAAGGAVRAPSRPRVLVTARTILGTSARLLDDRLHHGGLEVALDAGGRGRPVLDQEDRRRASPSGRPRSGSRRRRPSRSCPRSGTSPRGPGRPPPRRSARSPSPSAARAGRANISPTWLDDISSTARGLSSRLPSSSPPLASIWANRK